MLVLAGANYVGETIVFAQFERTHVLETGPSAELLICKY